MITLRAAQLDAFEAEGKRNFEDRMLAHVHEHFPEACQKRTVPELRDVIRYGIELADSYGIDEEDCVKVYIHLMFCLGINFDVDPRYPWAEPILLDESLTQAEAMQELTESACPLKPGESDDDGSEG